MWAEFHNDGDRPLSKMSQKLSYDLHDAAIGNLLTAIGHGHFLGRDRQSAT
jgi:hypothetical protein